VCPCICWSYIYTYIDVFLAGLCVYPAALRAPLVNTSDAMQPTGKPLCLHHLGQNPGRSDGMQAGSSEVGSRKSCCIGPKTLKNRVLKEASEQAYDGRPFAFVMLVTTVP
jgi:hypothetical protein